MHNRYTQLSTKTHIHIHTPELATCRETLGICKETGNENKWERESEKNRDCHRMHLGTSNQFNILMLSFAEYTLYSVCFFPGSLFPWAAIATKRPKQYEKTTPKNSKNQKQRTKKKNTEVRINFNRLWEKKSSEK